MTTYTSCALVFATDLTKVDKALMDRAFALVSNPEDWKDRIDAKVTRAQLKEANVTIENVYEAVGFYTATEADIETLKNGDYRVRSIGYRMGPAGP